MIIGLGVGVSCTRGELRQRQSLPARRRWSTLVHDGEPFSFGLPRSYWDEHMKIRVHAAPRDKSVEFLP